MSSEIRVNSLTNRSGLSTVTIADTGAVVAGMITATTFSGPLTGAVTGNVTGNLTGNVTGNVTGNSDTASNLTGSPSITVTDITTTGNVSVGGTLTYEDVTNIDAVGIITAQSDVLIGGNLSVTSGISTFKSLDYAAIDSTISDTAVDVFIYDTSKDSDGGAWRKRTQNTSWYNETLGTATRGTRKEFPAVAVIVAETSKVTIYDGDDPDLPLWITFPTTTAKGVTALNGELCLCSYASASAYHGLLRINFVADQAINHRESNSATVQGYFIYTLSSTDLAKIDDGPSSWTGYTSEVPNIVNINCSDVAMTVLPNAPVDSATGLPVPTIAVATNGGLSIIKDDGTVVDNVRGTNDVTSITFDKDNSAIFAWGTSSGAPRHITRLINSVWNTPSSSSSLWTNNYFSSYNEGLGNSAANFDSAASGVVTVANSGRHFGIEYATGNTNDRLGILHPKNLTNYADQNLSAFITSSYNTGWMHGDIKGTFLSDTTAETMSRSSATELVTNGTSWTGASGTTTPTGWTSWGFAESAFTIDSGRLKIGNGAANNSTAMHQNVTTVVGQVYTFYFDYQLHSSAQYAIIRVGTSNLNGSLGQLYGTSTSSTSSTLTFVATTTTTNISVQLQSTSGNAYIWVDNLSVKAVGDIDRSINNNGLAVYGTITKSAVATGADLVAYSGFSGSNYLEQPYNTDLNFGTGDFSCISWVKHPNTFASNQHSHIISKINPEASGQFTIQYNTDSTLYLRSGATSYTNIGPLSTNTWQQIAFVRRSGVLYGYKDGNFIGSSNFSADISNNESLRVGIRNSGYIGSWPGSLALLRISGSAPSDEQIKKIYEDEKCLFQENAKATLYGSSDTVTALAFDDDTNLLHVGTSSGRSDFQGLRRINNNTTAVTTAITAQNEFIIEQ